MKYIILAILLINNVSASLIGSDRTSRLLIESIRSFPEAKHLIEKATRDGSITLNVSHIRLPFEAMWEPSCRQITLDGTIGSSRGKLMRDLIFELHNAITSTEDDRIQSLARRGLITCDEYVLKIEQLEHENVLKTADLVIHGIAAGAYPEDARWNIIKNFNTHYKIQQLMGHSEAIVEEYKHFQPQKYRLNPYHGTIKRSHNSRENERMLEKLMNS